MPTDPKRTCWALLGGTWVPEGNTHEILNNSTKPWVLERTAGVPLERSLRVSLAGFFGGSSSTRLGGREAVIMWDVVHNNK